MLDPEYAYHRDYVRGMKTGFTTLAGRCFVTFAEQDGHTYGLVVLGSDMNNIYASVRRSWIGPSRAFLTVSWWTRRRC